MASNPILEELHEVRQQILAEYDGDTAAYLRDAQIRLEASGRPIDRRKQRTVQWGDPAKSGDSGTAPAASTGER